MRVEEEETTEGDEEAFWEDRNHRREWEERHSRGAKPDPKARRRTRDKGALQWAQNAITFIHAK